MLVGAGPVQDEEQLELPDRDGVGCGPQLGDVLLDLLGLDAAVHHLHASAREVPGRLGRGDALGQLHRGVLDEVASDLLVLARSDAALPLEHAAELDFPALVSRVVRRFESTASARPTPRRTASFWGTPIRSSVNSRCRSSTPRTGRSPSA